MNVLVTGGTGIISSGIVEEAVKQGYTVYAITRGIHNYRNVKGASYIMADVWDKKKIKEIMDGLKIDIVVECLVYSPEQLKISLENFAKRCKQYVFISTTAIYSYSKEKLNENAEQNQMKWRYTREKIECEKIIRQYYINVDDKFYTIVRPFVTYGNYRVPFPVISRKNQWTIFERINQNCPIVACKNVKIPIVHIDDFSYATVKLFNNEKAKNEAFHIAEAGKEIFWDDVVKVSAKVLHKKVNIIHVPVELFRKVFYDLYEELKWNKTTEMFVDDKKLKLVIGNFEQKINITKGISKTIDVQRTENEKGYNTIDYEWWLNCDLILIYAYLKGKLELKEKEIVKNYIKKISIKDKIVILKIYIKQRLRAVKRILRKIIKRHLGG